MAQTVLFGRYRLLERAGTGGTADVWCARDERTGDDVALKRLHPIVFRSRSGRSRLEREFRALRSLNEPNIVRVRDLVLTDDDGALILDFVAGRSLEARLADGRPMSVAESVAIADQVGAALNAAHAAGIIHRDVKPGNVLLSPDGVARLTDFGIAQGGLDETAVTATGTVVGTLRYLAPEQLRGELATASGDLYGLAAMTYEMIAGRPAYAATTPVALVDEQAAGPARLAGVATGVERVVRRGMSSDPADRQASVDDFTRDLRKAAGRKARDAVPAVVAASGPALGIGAVWAGAPVIASAAAVAPPPQSDPRAPVAFGKGDIARAPVGRRRRPPVALLGGVTALAFAGLVLAALAAPSGQVTRGAADGATPTPAARATPSPTPQPAKAKPNDKAKGKGHHGGDGGD